MFGSLFGNRNNQQETIDFFVTGKEFINGVGDEAKQKIDGIYSECSEELKSNSINIELKKPIEAKNYGRGADWVLAAVEFLATNPYANAAATTGGLITLGKHVVSFFNKRKEDGVFLGIDAGRMFAAAKLAEDNEVTNITTLNQIEINRSETGFDNREYLYVFGVNESEYDMQDSANADKYFKGDIFIVHLSWKGDVISVSKY